MHEVDPKNHERLQFLKMKPAIDYLTPVKGNVSVEAVLTRFYTDLVMQPKLNYLSDLILYIFYNDEIIKQPSFMEEAQSSSVSGSTLLEVEAVFPSMCVWWGSVLVHLDIHQQSIRYLRKCN